MAQLSISLFGGIRVVPFGFQLKNPLSEKELALLAFLVVEMDRPYSRVALAALLWPEQPEDASRSNLRQNLHRLREALVDSLHSCPYLLITPREIQFNRQSDYWLDVAEIDQALCGWQLNHRGSALLGENLLECFTVAVDLYKGDFLAGFSLRNCREFEYWLLGKQEKYHQQILEILACLVRHYGYIRDYFQASQYAQRAIELEPWRESAHRQKMRVLALGGQRGGALRQYEICCKILATELGVKPSAETNLLYQQIRKGVVPVTV